ncbi:MAG: hypothetical protein KDA94_09040, partial [Acidimicrobiales bacterium]|nr:hypothetical protein [Acidimicrobiales bacterium]
VRRRAGLAVAGWWAAVALVLIGGFGLDALSQPWNPWVALLPFAALILIAWRSLDGWVWAPVWAAAAGSYAIQGHVGYGPVALPLVAISVVAPVVVAQRQRRGALGADQVGPPDGTDLPDGSGGPSRTSIGPVAAVALSVLAALVCWSGPIWDVLTRDPSNARKLLDNFGHPSEPPLGLAEGARTFLRGIHPFGAWATGSMALDASWLPGAVLVGLWAGVVVATLRCHRHGDGGPAVQRSRRALLQLDAVLGVALGCGLFAVTRIFGAPFLYTYRWIVVLAAFTVFTLGWGAALLVATSAARSESIVRAGATRRPVVVACGALLAVASIATAVRVGRQQNPYPYSWREARVLAPATVRALPQDRRYLVAWDDPVYLGGLGFGLLLDLERHGFDVGAAPQYEAAVEPHRVRCPGGYDALVTVVTGPQAIAAWKQRPGAQLIAEVGARPGFDYDQTFEALREELERAGTTRTPEQLERSLSGVVLNPANSPRVRELASALVDNDVPSAVFVQDPAPEPAPVDPGVLGEPCRRSP